MHNNAEKPRRNEVDPQLNRQGEVQSSNAQQIAAEQKGVEARIATLGIPGLHADESGKSLKDRRFTTTQKVEILRMCGEAMTRGETQIVEKIAQISTINESSIHGWARSGEFAKYLLTPEEHDELSQITRTLKGYELPVSESGRRSYPKEFKILVLRAEYLTLKKVDARGRHALREVLGVGSGIVEWREQYGVQDQPLNLTGAVVASGSTKTVPVSVPSSPIMQREEAIVPEATPTKPRITSRVVTNETALPVPQAQESNGEISNLPEFIIAHLQADIAYLQEQNKQLMTELMKHAF